MVDFRSSPVAAFRLRLASRIHTTCGDYNNRIMPILKPCRSNCTHLVSREKPCPVHGRHLKPSEHTRQNTNAQGYTYRWSQYSKRFLARNPLCVMCEAKQKIRAAECVDHINPVTSPDDPGFYELSNLQPLCWSCHSLKTRSDMQKGLTRK